MKHHRLSAFFLITFGISWGIRGLGLPLSAPTGAFEVSLRGYFLLSCVAIWTPAISGLTVAGITQGWVGVRA